MVILREEMKIGPKGQVVIPRAIRKIKGFVPGSKVVFELEGDLLILTPARKLTSEEILKVFSETAKSGRPMKFDADKNYDEMMEDRLGWIVTDVRRH